MTSCHMKDDFHSMIPWTDVPAESRTFIHKHTEVDNKTVSMPFDSKKKHLMVTIIFKDCILNIVQTSASIVIFAKFESEI